MASTVVYTITSKKDSQSFTSLEYHDFPNSTVANRKKITGSIIISEPSGTIHIPRPQKTFNIFCGFQHIHYV